MSAKPFLNVTLLAGGLGKRMQSSLPKILHKVNKISMLSRIIQQISLYELKFNHVINILIVVGKYKDIIKTTIEEELTNLKLYFILEKIQYVMQDEPLGTGHAVLCTLPFLNDRDVNLILNADTPMLSHETLENIINNFMSSKNILNITAIDATDPSGCGRIIMKDGMFDNITEEKDCDETKRKINIINCGIYIGLNSTWKKYVPLIENFNSQKEYYLTDVVKLCNEDETLGKNKIGLFILDKKKEYEIVNINTKEQLDKLNKIFI